MFRHAIDIAPLDIDHMGHVNNSVYLRWVQDAVVKYWEKLAPAEAIAEHLWVALQHDIIYRKPTFLSDSIVAEVVAEKVRGARAFFSTMVTRGGEVLVEVKSCWCCLDAATKRPVRLRQEIADRFLVPGPVGVVKVLATVR